MAPTHEIDPYALRHDLRSSGLSLPDYPAHAYVWPTESCSIGCRHCNFSSKAGPQDTYNRGRPEDLVDWLNQSGVRRSVLCGGGEPLDDNAYCAKFFAAIARTGMHFAIYTAGTSLAYPQTAGQVIDAWLAESGGDHPRSVWIRLSVDPFHSERVGLDPIVDWITELCLHSPAWNVSLRTVRLDGDRTLHQLAQRLGGRLCHTKERVSHIKVYGRSISIDQKGLVLDGRASLAMLPRRGLRLTPTDDLALRRNGPTFGQDSQVGRPLSRRVPISRARANIEVRPDGSVNLVEVKPADSGHYWSDTAWPEIRDRLSLDPIVHAAVSGGLPPIAQAINELSMSHAVDRGTRPSSVGQVDLGDLEVLRALLIESGPLSALYPRAVHARASTVLHLRQQNHGRHT